MDEAGVRKVIAENNQDLIVQIKDLINTSISDLKRSNESIASQQMSEITEEAEARFRSSLQQKEQWGAVQSEQSY